MKINKFRGYSEILKKWIFGVPYFSNGEWWILVDDNFKNEDIGTGSYCVNKDSISEYTTVKDKNNLEIYEGDVLKGGIYLSYVVAWDACNSTFNLNEYSCRKGFEVIGNIYENKDLLSEVK